MLKRQKSQIGLLLEKAGLTAVVVSKIGRHYNTKTLISHQESLKPWREILNYNNEPVITYLPYSELFSKELSLDAQLNDDAIYRYLRQNINRLFNCKSGELVFDYVRLTDARQQQAIRVIACHQEKVTHIIQQFNQQKLKLKAIEVDAFSLLRLSAFGRLTFKDLQALLLAEGHMLRFFVYDKSHIRYVKSYPLNNLTDQVEAIISLLRLYQTGFNQQPIKKIVLFGGLIKKLELIAAIRQQFSIEVEVFQPYEALSTPASWLGFSLALRDLNAKY